MSPSTASSLTFRGRSSELSRLLIDGLGPLGGPRLMGGSGVLPTIGLLAPCVAPRRWAGLKEPSGAAMNILAWPDTGSMACTAWTLFTCTPLAEMTFRLCSDTCGCSSESMLRKRGTPLKWPPLSSVKDWGSCSSGHARTPRRRSRRRDCATASRRDARSAGRALDAPGPAARWSASGTSEQLVRDQDAHGAAAGQATPKKSDRRHKSRAS
eukprot:scaffold7640_cov239-Pinguiococcus_pyrenoidosus.AAC.2